MKKRSVTPFRPVHPSPAGLITSISEEGVPNIISLAEVFNVIIGNPVIVGIAIAKPRYSHELISTTREFVVNLPTASMLETVDKCGSVSGRDVDKFAAFGLTPIPADKVKPPLIAECLINIECRLLDVREVGDHDLFLGEVVAEHGVADALDEDDRILVKELDPLCYLHGEYWTCAKRIGTHGFTRD